MQGYKSDQEGVRCDSVSLRCMIPDDHLLVRIHESKELDLSSIYEITKKCYCANYGRPSIDSVLFFKMQIICYPITGGHCKNCPLKPSCIADNYSNRARFIYRNPYQDEIDEVKARQNRIDFKQKLIERKWKIEGIFAEAKENHGLRRTQFRGVQKTQIQIFMIAIVQNFKRILKIIFWFFYLLLLNIKNITIFVTLMTFSTVHLYFYNLTLEQVYLTKIIG
ncbi:transposase [Candidatus Tisiphia endosymbiont of Ditula angustiorana]|uniref:transposase n=1 Tax=Candidatus Tisiphia endosymbiont of Ditula angustiorana TaxID=3066272 RepID=UPI00312C970A